MAPKALSTALHKALSETLSQALAQTHPWLHLRTSPYRAGFPKAFSKVLHNAITHPLSQNIAQDLLNSLDPTKDKVTPMCPIGGQNAPTNSSRP